MSACVCCEKELVFRWADQHGVAVCCNCGIPYQLYFYENDERVEKPPKCIITEKGVELGKRYFKETGQPCFAGAFCMGIERNGKTYSGHTKAQIDAWYRWLEINGPQPPHVQEAGGEKGKEGENGG